MSTRIQNVHAQEYNGTKFRSTLEAQTAQVLDALHIPYSYEGRRITLQEGFRCPYQKDKVREVSYTPDFEIGPIMLECKGFETPEWKIKKKLLFKYLMENEPNTIFYQVKDAKKQLLLCLDNYWPCLGYMLFVSPKPKKKEQPTTTMYASVSEAMYDLKLQNKAIGPILSCLTGKKQYVYGYNWKVEQIKL